MPIPPLLVAHLHAHLDQFPPGPDRLVFTNTAGKPLHHSRYSRAFTTATRQIFPAGSPLRRSSPYDLRHANATMLLKAGVPLGEAARRLGHSPDVLLKTYAGVTSDDHDVANARLDAVLSPSASNP